MSTLFIGIGNRWRRDDGVGPALAERVRARAWPDVAVADASDDVLGLIARWPEYEIVVMADAVRAEQAPGTLIRRDPVAVALPREWCALSSHQFGPADAIELARTLKRLPSRLIFIGIVGEDFSDGEGLTAAVAQALPAALALVSAERRPLAAR